MARVFQQHSVMVDGVNICVFESGTRGAQQVLLVHATGFHARCWDAVINYLPAQWQVFALDLRGHGRSDKMPPYTWDRFERDLAAVAKHFDLRDTIGVGHSLGGHCVAHLCAVEPDYFKRLVLVDPVIFAQEMYGADMNQATPLEDHPVSRRRSYFESWEAMYSRFEGRYPYSVWEPRVLRDYCELGVSPCLDRPGVELACPPAVEASIYAGSYGADIYPLLEKIVQPVTLLRAKPRDPDSTVMDFSTSPTWPGLAGVMQNATDIYLPELTHFMPMQVPQQIAAYIAGPAEDDVAD